MSYDGNGGCQAAAHIIHTQPLVAGVYLLAEARGRAVHHDRGGLVVEVAQLGLLVVVLQRAQVHVAAGDLRGCGGCRGVSVEGPPRREGWRTPAPPARAGAGALPGSAPRAAIGAASARAAAAGGPSRCRGPRARPAAPQARAGAAAEDHGMLRAAAGARGPRKGAWTSNNSGFPNARATPAPPGRGIPRHCALPAPLRPGPLTWHSGPLPRTMVLWGFLPASALRLGRGGLLV
jgi:hypothetical protein